MTLTDSGDALKPGGVSLRLTGGLDFVATNHRGHTVALSSSLDGSERTAATPMEMVLVALGGCAAMDVLSILRKMRHDVAGYEVVVEGERAPEYPRVYTSVVIRHRVYGTGVPEAGLHRAIALSMETYCPVFAMLSPSVPITSRYEIVDDVTREKVVEGDVTVSADEEGPR